MVLVVGLGNPGSRYTSTRHNFGFRVVDELARRLGIPWTGRFAGWYAAGAGGVALLKPRTFMNRSGESVAAALQHHEGAPEQVLVAHDEVDLPFGTLRLKFGGGEAGHRGLLSISEALGSRDYGRLRLGVGRPPADFSGTVADFVLDPFAPEQELAIGPLLGVAAEAVEAVVQQGLEAAMNQVNRKS